MVPESVSIMSPKQHEVLSTGEDGHGHDVSLIKLTHNESQALPDKEGREDLSPSALQRNRTNTILSDTDLKRKFKLKGSRKGTGYRKKREVAASVVLGQYTPQEESKKQL